MMKFLSILAAASLALTPVIASADSHGATGNSALIPPGGTAGRVLAASQVPEGAIIVGGLVLLGGALFFLIGGKNDSNNDTNGGNGGNGE